MNQWGETETRPRHKLFHEGRLFLQQLDGFVPAFSDLGALACPGLPVSIPCQPSAERPFSTMLNAYAESNRPPGVILCFQQLDGFVSTFFPMGPGTLPHLGPAGTNDTSSAFVAMARAACRIHPAISCYLVCSTS
jgi:hypothetical protein